MTPEELKGFAKSFSCEEGEVALETLKETGTGDSHDKTIPTFPLRGMPGTMTDPFEPACDPQEWDALREDE